MHIMDLCGLGVVGNGGTKSFLKELHVAWIELLKKSKVELGVSFP